MIITVMRNTECLRVSFGTVMYGEARVAPDDKFDFVTGICVAMVKANDKTLKGQTKLFYSTYWKEFDLDDPYVELVMKHQRNYNREIATRRERHAIYDELDNISLHATTGTHKKYHATADIVILSPWCNVEGWSEGSVALKHALALRKELDEEAKWQKEFGEGHTAKETEGLPWPLLTHKP